MNFRTRGMLALLGLLSSTAWTAEQPSPRAPVTLPAGLVPQDGKEAYPSTYRPAPTGVIAIVNATILTAAGPKIERGRVIIASNRIVAVGTDAPIPSGAEVIDAAGKWITPGLIDGHSHAGKVSIPLGSLNDGLNEGSDPNTAQILVEHSLWAQSPEFAALRAAGVTSLLVLPGSTNIFAGRGVVLKNVASTTVQQMKFPGAPYTLKMACGENPLTYYGLRGRAPLTRGGEVAMARATLLNAADYNRRWSDYRRKTEQGERADPPRRDLQLEALGDMLTGRARSAVHCYRAEDMAIFLDMAREFDFQITGFHHATEAFKIIPLLKARGACVLTWGPDWGGFKMEAYDHSDLTVAMIAKAGGCVAVTSDSVETAQHLNLDAARSMAAGNDAGLAIDEAEAIRWISINPANALGIDSQTGSLEPGKMADLVIWNSSPFSSYAFPERVLIDGVEVYRRGDGRYSQSTDFELYQPSTREIR